ncbi:MAG: hypothetical protein E7318_06315 [Clostridiales bacterium]|nr:hypothetical protein [Clostridiales bacterium]
MNRSFKRILAMILAAILLCSVFTIAQAAPEKKKITVMLYMCGTDLESNNGQATRDLGSILNSRYNTDEINVIALAGGTFSWKSGYSSDALTVLNVSGRRPQVVTTLPLSSMGDPATLSTFIDYCHANYPAEQYVLNLWDHGGGPVRQLCIDQLFKSDGLTTTELVTALDNSVFKKNPVDLLLMHACLMSSAEISYAVAPYAKYMVASEDSFFGFTYDWLSGAESTDIISSAKKLVDSTFQSNGDTIARQNESEKNSIALIDLSKIQALVKTMDAYFPLVESKLSIASFSRMSAQRRDSASFGTTESGGFKGYDLVDLGDLVSKTQEAAPKEAKAVLTALEEAVIYCRAGNEGCTGLTVYHPFANKNYLEEFIAVYNELDFSAGYTDYMHRFASLLTSTPLAKWTDLRTDRMSAEKAIRTLFTMGLTQEQAEHYGDSRFEALLQHEDGTYTLAYVTNKTALEDGALTGEFGGIALYAVDQNGSALTPAIDYSVTENGLYVIPCELTKKGEEGVADYTAQALVYCAYDAATGKLQPGRVYLWNEAMNAYNGSVALSFEEYDAVKLTVEHRQEKRNAEGTLLPFEQWDVVRSESWESAIDDTWTFQMLEDTIDTAKLFATFQIADSQNNLYNSELLGVKVQLAEGDVTRVTYDDKLFVLDKCAVTINAGQLLLTVNLQNNTELETVYELGDVVLNGTAVDASATIYGSGDNWGLLQGETQYAMVPVSLASLTDPVLTSITFNLNCLDAATNESKGVVPVEILLHCDLSAQ